MIKDVHIYNTIWENSQFSIAKR